MRIDPLILLEPRIRLAEVDFCPILKIPALKHRHRTVRDAIANDEVVDLLLFF